MDFEEIFPLFRYNTMWLNETLLYWTRPCGITLPDTTLPYLAARQNITTQDTVALRDTTQRDIAA